MSTAQHVLTWNDRILDYVLKLKTTSHPDLTVVLRKKQDERFRAGHWFRGSHYISIGLITSNGRLNRTKQLGLVFRFDRSGMKNAHLQIDFQRETDPALIAFHHDLVEALGRFIKTSARTFYRPYFGIDVYKVLDDFFLNDWNVIRQVVARHGLSEHVILPESKFQNLVTSALSQREALQRNAAYRPTEETQRVHENHGGYDETGPLPNRRHNVSDKPREARPYPKEQPLKDSGMSEAAFDKIEATILRKKQVIFQGPPGTGKSYLADVFARYLTNNQPGQYEAVQFHPNYAYEDFVEGLRPDPDTGLVGVQPGIFKVFCERASNEAKRRADKKFVLLIDEINRGHLSKIFGELLYLLEYRDRKIKLTYQPHADFSIPSNLFILGTMNTADRSLVTMDYALRRRFAFVPLKPDYDLLRNLLATRASVNVETLVSNLERINKRIAGTASLGSGFEIGHSYFLKDETLSLQTLEVIWETELKPLVDDYFFDAPDEVKRFEKQFFENL